MDVCWKRKIGIWGHPKPIPGECLDPSDDRQADRVIGHCSKKTHGPAILLARGSEEREEIVLFEAGSVRREIIWRRGACLLHTHLFVSMAGV